ncbi:MAG TPA: recombination protein O N-terminal domain-containing protein [Candidatus Paceibacterota bacterium]|nr:recombination protein O N-terminal domain-containing protein [Candidatus Paceibacterota bacterium]
MRHKYSTRAIVLGRSPSGEESISASLLTEDFGLIRARSQGARKRGSKMSAGLQTLSSSDVTLLRGRDGWRMAGAVLETNWARVLSPDARRRAARVLELADRLIRGEHEDAELFAIISGFLAAIPGRSDDDGEALETLVVVRLLHALGFDAGDTLGATDAYTDDSIAQARAARTNLISRINRGIAASGL